MRKGRKAKIHILNPLRALRKMPPLQSGPFARGCLKTIIETAFYLTLFFEGGILMI